MRYMPGVVVAILISLAAPRAVRAQSSFEEIANEAIRVDRDGLAGVLWAMNAQCADGDDLTKRQCRTVRDVVKARFDGQMLIVPGDASAFTVGDFDAKKKNAPIILKGCIACVDPIDVDGAKLYITSDNRDKPVHQTSRTFKSEDATASWKATTVPRLQVEFVVSLPKTLKTWKDDKKTGVSLAVLGFRVYDPCDGGIICASPKSGKASINKGACGGAVVEGTTEDEPEGGGEVKPAELPGELSASMIKAAMAPVREAATKCFDKYGVAGDAKLHVTVSGEGAVVMVDQSGDFEGTPTGECLERAVEPVVFPKTKKSRQSFKYPIVLR